jgi:hypothetical protein
MHPLYASPSKSVTALRKRPFFRYIVSTVSARLLLLVLLLLPASTQAGEVVWVFFSDKGVGEQRLQTALQDRLQELSPRSVERRLKARSDLGVDVRDLAVDTDYIDEVVSTGAELRVASRWLNAVSVEASEEQIEFIFALPFVTGVRPVRSGVLHDIDIDYGNAAQQLGLIEVPELHACGLTGEGIVVGLLDTGFSTEHRAFDHLQVQAEHDFVNDDDNTADEAGDPAGQDEHGTKVLSMLAGLDPDHYAGAAPYVTVLLAKIDNLAVDDPAESDWWVAGLEWIEAQGADVASGSIGFCATCPPERMDGQTEPTTIAATVAVQNGLIVVNSAGNRGPDPMTLNAPADADGLIAVGSVDPEGRLTIDSSRGPTWDGRIKPDIMAPGRNVWLVDPTSTDAYQQKSGTSYAAPLVAGIIALLLEAYPDLGPYEMHALITSTGSQAEAPTSDYGWGRIRGLEAAGLYCSCRDADQDGHYADDCGGDDCDDENAAVHPEAEESCNGIDDDCDGSLLAGEEDQDQDGHLACAGDCDDKDAQIHPGAEDLCGDGIDSDCDGADPECEVEGEGCGCRSAVGGSGLLLLLVFIIARCGSAASCRR